VSSAVARFHHEALLYSGSQGFLQGTMPFVRRAVAAAEPTLIVVDVPKIDLLRRELGDDRADVEFADMAQLGRNPACIIAAWQDFVDRHADNGRRLWGVGEPVSATRAGDEVVECQGHEALVNIAFDEGPPWSLLCPYDISALAPPVVDAVDRTHPWLSRGGRTWSSARYGGAALAAELLQEPLPPPTCDVRQLSFDRWSLRAVRELVHAHAAPVLDGARTADLVLAVSEIAANSVLHAGGRGVVRVWHEREGIVCEVSDTGRIDEPLAGRIRPAPAQPDGRGLWIVNQLCDLVQVRSYGAGSTVRVHMRRAG
jgi:anti-sigma regulatory factor (Ser/Thr protein kinase)